MRVVIALFAVLSAVNSAKILIVIPTMAHSHITIATALAKGLASRGHEITFVTPIEEKEPVKNIKSVFLSYASKIAKGKKIIL